MAETGILPHDRGHLLWTADEGVSRLLLSSMDRWVTTILADDCIDSPLFGMGEKTTATIIAKDDGLVAGPQRRKNGHLLLSSRLLVLARQLGGYWINGPSILAGA